MYALDSSVSRKYIRHCIVGQIKYGRYMCKVKLIDIIFDRIKPESTLDNALLVKSKMVTFSTRLKYQWDIIFARQTIPKYFKDQRWSKRLQSIHVIMPTEMRFLNKSNTKC